MGFVFLLMPFNNERAESIKEIVIRKVCGELGLELKRADDWSSSTAIIDDIVNAIREADVVIADITGSNPNVFYELGYAHAVKPRRTILITSDPPEQSPFDVRHYRVFKYGINEPEREYFRKKLKNAIEDALKAPSNVINLDDRCPVLRFCFEDGETVKNISINDYVTKEKPPTLLLKFGFPQESTDQLEEKYYMLKFCVINEGTAPANDVKVFIYFPEEIRIVQSLSWLPTAFLNKDLVILEEENQVTFEVGKLGHGLRHVGDVVYVNFKAGEPHDFSIEYSIYCDELPEHVTGNLEVHFQD